MQTIIILTSTFPRWANDEEPPFVYELCKRLNKYFRVIVLAPHCKGALNRENLSGIEVNRFHYFPEKYETLCYEGGMIARLKLQPLRHCLIPFFFFFQFIALLRLLKKESPALIHAHWILPQGFIAVAARMFCRKKTPVLCTSHGGDLFSLKGRIAQCLKRWVLIKTDEITVVNSVMQQIVVALTMQSANVHVIPMGVDTKTVFTPDFKRQKPFSLLFVGRLVEKKGLRFLINTLPEILERYPLTTLTIIGSGPEAPALQQQVLDKNLSKQVVFTGPVHNRSLPAYYQRHQIAVFPFIIGRDGDREGLPVVVSEAIACGCNIVTTDLPGIEDLMRHNKHGIIVAQKNSAALTQGILLLFDNPKQAQTLKTNALRHVQQISDWEVIANRYHNLIQTSIEQSGQ